MYKYGYELQTGDFVNIHVCPSPGYHKINEFKEHPQSLHYRIAVFDMDCEDWSMTISYQDRYEVLTGGWSIPN